MAALKHIVVLGATGNLGGPIIRGLLERKKDFDSITAVTSNDPNSQKFDKMKQQGVNVVRVDYSDQVGLISAFKGKDALIIGLSGPVLRYQIAIIDAAIDAGVRRVYPSEFGFDYTIPENQIPALSGKVEAHEYLKRKAKEGKISYTIFVTGTFLDWSLVTGFIGFNLKEKTVTLYNGGRDELAGTPTDDVGKYVAASLVNSSASHNKVIRIQSYSITTAKVLELLEKYSGSMFTVVNKTAKELDDEIQAHWERKESTDWFVKSIVALHCHGHGTYSPIDNHLFPEVTPTPLEETIEGVVNGKFDYFLRP